MGQKAVRKLLAHLASQGPFYCFLLAGLVLLLTFGCKGTNYVEVEVSSLVNVDPQIVWQGDSCGVWDVNLGRYKRLGNWELHAEWNHVSNLCAGWPFNGDAEHHMDRIKAGARYEF